MALFDPGGARERLALRTVPIAATVVRDASVMTGIALFDMTAERSGTTCGDRPHDAPLRVRQRRLVIGAIRRAVAAEDIRHFELGPLHAERGSEVLRCLRWFRG